MIMHNVDDLVSLNTFLSNSSVWCCVSTSWWLIQIIFLISLFLRYIIIFPKLVTFTVLFTMKSTNKTGVLLLFFSSSISKSYNFPHRNKCYKIICVWHIVSTMLFIKKSIGWGKLIKSGNVWLWLWHIHIMQMNVSPCFPAALSKFASWITCPYSVSFSGRM